MTKLIRWGSKVPEEAEDPYNTRLNEAIDIAGRVKRNRSRTQMNSVTEEDIISKLEEDLISMGEHPDVAHEAALAQVRTHPVVQSGENTAHHYISLAQQLPAIKEHLREVNARSFSRYHATPIVGDDAEVGFTVGMSAIVFSIGGASIGSAVGGGLGAIAGGGIIPTILTTIGTREYWVNGIRKRLWNRRQSKERTDAEEQLSELEQELAMYDARPEVRDVVLYDGRHGTSIGQLTNLTSEQATILQKDRTKEAYEAGEEPENSIERIALDSIQLVLIPGPVEYESESILHLPQQTPITLINEDQEVIDCGFIGERYAGMNRNRQGIVLFNSLACDNGDSYHTLEELDEVEVRELIPLQTYERT